MAGRKLRRVEEEITLDQLHDDNLHFGNLEEQEEEDPWGFDAEQNSCTLSNESHCPPNAKSDDVTINSYLQTAYPSIFDMHKFLDEETFTNISRKKPWQ